MQILSSSSNDLVCSLPKLPVCNFALNFGVRNISAAIDITEKHIHTIILDNAIFLSYGDF